MANTYYTSNPDIHVLPLNASFPEYNTAPNSILAGNRPALGASLQIFPTWITNDIFNSIYAFGILANVVLLAYLISYKRYKTPLFCVILSLGVADLGVCIGAVLYYTLISPNMTVPLWLCNMTAAFLALAYLSSSYHVAMFAALRCLQLAFPLRSHAKVTTSLLLKICLVIWAVHTIQAVVLACYFETMNLSTRPTNDVYVCLFTGNQHVRVLWTIIVWGVVPFLATSGFHVAKQLMVVISRSAMMTSQDELVQHVRKQTDSRALAIVIFVYLVTVLPYIIQSFRVYVFYVSYNAINVYLAEAFGQIAYVNSAINPWVYLFAAESVRSDIRKMIACDR